MRWAFGVLIAGLMCAPAAAQQTALVELPRLGDRSLSFVDVGGIRSSGSDVAISLLDATATPEGQDVPVKGTLLSYHISCEWDAIAPVESRDIDINGDITATRQLEGGMRFLEPTGQYRDMARLACDLDRKTDGALSSLRDAMAQAARSTRRRPAPQPRDPNAPIPTVAAPPPIKQVTLQNFGGQKPSAYALVRADKASGNALFLDWGNYRREKNMVEALTFWVLGDDPTIEFRRGLMKHASVEIDCGAKTMRVMGAQTFGRGLTPEFERTTSPWLWVSVAGSPLRTELLNVACKGRKPNKTLATMADAVAHAEQRRK
jgi:hypothetical protein